MKTPRLALGLIVLLVLLAALAWKFWPATVPTDNAPDQAAPAPSTSQVAQPAAKPATRPNETSGAPAKPLNVTELFAKQAANRANHLLDLQNQQVEIQKEIQAAQAQAGDKSQTQGQPEELLQLLEGEQTRLQTQIATYTTPLPPPTDLGEIDLAEGTPLAFTLKSGEPATLLAALQANGDIFVTFSLIGGQLNAASSVAAPGEPTAITAGNYTVGFVLRLKGGATSAHNPAAPPSS